MTGKSCSNGPVAVAYDTVIRGQVVMRRGGEGGKVKMMRRNGSHILLGVEGREFGQWEEVVVVRK